MRAAKCARSSPDFRYLSHEKEVNPLLDLGCSSKQIAPSWAEEDAQGVEGKQSTHRGARLIGPDARSVPTYSGHFLTDDSCTAENL